LKGTIGEPFGNILFLLFSDYYGEPGAKAAPDRQGDEPLRGRSLSIMDQASFDLGHTVPIVGVNPTKATLIMLTGKWREEQGFDEADIDVLEKSNDTDRARWVVSVRQLSVPLALLVETGRANTRLLLPVYVPNGHTLDAGHRRYVSVKLDGKNA
jgi:hypothetical protein